MNASGNTPAVPTAFKNAKKTNAEYDEERA